MEATAGTERGSPPAAEGGEITRRITATFTSPSALAALIRDRPRWLDVLLLSTAVAIAAAAMLPPETFLETSREAVNRRGAPVEITSPPEEIVRWGRYLAMLSATVGHPLVAFALAGVLTLLFTMVPRGRNTFMEHVALSSHALLIAAFGSVVGIALRLLSGEAEAHVSLAMLAPFLDAGSPVREFLELISPFTLWMLTVVAFGVAALDPRRSRASTVALLVGGYLVLALVLAA